MLNEDSGALDLTNHEIARGATADSGVESATNSSDVGVLSRLADNVTLRKAVAALSTFIAGAGVSSTLTGCGPEEPYKMRSAVSRMLEKEAKFSTLAVDAKVAVSDTPELLAQRELLMKAIDGVIPSARELVTTFEADGKLHLDSLEQYKKELKSLQTALAKATGEESFAPVKVKLEELSNKVAEFQLVTAADFATCNRSAGYTKAQDLMQSLHDWHNVLERDVGRLAAGVYALKLAGFLDTLTRAENQLKIIEKEESIAKAEIVDRAEARKEIDVLAKYTTAIDKIEKDYAFASVREDLGDLRKLLADISIRAQDGKSEKALIREAIELVGALRADLERELKYSVGAKVPEAPPQVKGAQAPQPAASSTPATQPVSLWYLVINQARPGVSGYSYVPNQTPTYSDVSRLRSSPQYAAFAKTSQDNHSFLTNHFELSSHGAGPLGRPAPSVSASGIRSGGGSVISSHGADSGHVGGFNAGRSSSSGFGG